jgi:hypothetical protein
MTILNVAMRDESPVWNANTTEDIAWSPLRLALAVGDICEHNHDEWLKVLKGEADPEDYAEDTLYDSLYSCAKVVRDIIPNFDGDDFISRSEMAIDFNDMSWQPIYSMLIGARPSATVEPAKTVKTVITSYTDSMDLYWDNLRTLEKSTVLAIIVGQADIGTFDQFVSQWNAEGGAAILEEINDTLN